VSLPGWLRISSLLALFYCSSLSGETSPQVNIGLAAFSDQLSQPTITSIHMDHSGFLWIGTQLGLNRYDGSTLTIFNSSAESKNWVPASDISQIAEDSEGDIWIATYGGGLARYNGASKNFEAIAENSKYAYSFLKSLLISKNGNIWFGSRDAGVGMYDSQLQRYAPWLASNPLNQDMGQASDLLEDHTGRIWAAGANGLYLIDPGRQLILTYPLPSSSTPATSLITITAIEAGPPGVIWLGTSAGDILQFDIKEKTFTQGPDLPGFSANWITDLDYSTDILWVATDHGLHMIDPNSLHIRAFKHSNSLLSSDLTLCLLHGQGFMLVGTTLGLNIFSFTPFEKYQSSNSRVFDDVLSFAEGKNGAAWVGTYDGVYYLAADSQQHSPIEDIFKEISLNDRRVMTMAATDNELWLGYFRGGVQIIDLQDGSSHLPQLTSNTDLAVTKIAHTRDGASWVGTYNQGLFRIDGDKIESFYNPVDHGLEIPEPAVTLILETSDDSIIIGAETGLYSINYPARSVRALELLFRKDKIQPVILSLAQNQNGDVWIGTKDQGLFIWHLREEYPGAIQLVYASGNARLPSSTIYAIEFDDAGFAWVSTTSGITKLDSHGDVVSNYKAADGLQGNDFNFAASFKDSTGRLYFGGSNGYNRFDPGSETSAALPPRVVLTHLNIAGTEPSLPVAVHELESLELSHQDYFVTFLFSVLDYIDPANNRYRYKLENFDPQWIENGTRNSATYTNLPPGNYTFRVQGANSAGVWNRDGVSLGIIVHSAPWRSWQAYLSYFMIFIVIFMLAKKYYDNTTRRKQATVIAQEMYDAADNAADDLQEQLEYQDEFVKTVHAHNINTLELIRELIARQANFIDDDLAREAIFNNSKRVAALARLEECLFYQGDQLLANLEDYTNIIIDSLIAENPTIARSTTTIIEIPPRLIAADVATPLAVILFELLGNCFTHAFEDSSKANYIHVRMERIPAEDPGQEVSLKLSVEDSGVGIPGNISPASAETSGLAIVSSIVTRMGGELSISVNNGTVITVIVSSHSDMT